MRDTNCSDAKACAPNATRKGYCTNVKCNIGAEADITSFSFISLYLLWLKAFVSLLLMGPLYSI